MNRLINYDYIKVVARTIYIKAFGSYLHKYSVTGTCISCWPGARTRHLISFSLQIMSGRSLIGSLEAGWVRSDKQVTVMYYSF